MDTAKGMDNLSHPRLQFHGYMGSMLPARFAVHLLQGVLTLVGQ